MGKIGAEAIWKLASAIGTRYSSVQQNVSATVTRIDDDGKVWVTMPGSTTETPCEGITHKVTIGDTVSVSTGGNTAEVTGSTSSPSVPDQGLSKQIEIAKSIAKASKAAGEVARRLADQARQVAYATGQHFWHRVENTEGAGAGAFVTDVTREEFLSNVHAGVAGGFYDLGEPDQSYSDTISHEGDGETVTFALEFPTTDASTVTVTIDGSTADPSTYEVGESSVTFDSAPASGSEIVILYDRARRPWRNILINSFGILLRTGLNQLVSITSGAVTFFDGLGNLSSNIVALFGKDGFQIGRASKSHLVGDYHSLRLIDSEGKEYLHISDLSDEDGYATITQKTTLDGQSYSVVLEVSSMVYTPTFLSVGLEPDPGESWSYRYNPYWDNLTFYHWSTDEQGTITQELYYPPAGTVVTMVYKDKVHLNAYTLGQRRADSAVGPASMVLIGGSATGPYSLASGGTASGYNSTVLAATNRYGPKATQYFEDTEASGYCSLAMGLSTTASGDFAISEGRFTQASGKSSRAQNNGTIAAWDDQTAIGRHNDNSEDNAFEIGNGKVVVEDGEPVLHRSNAMEVDWYGNATFSGVVISGQATYGYLAGKFTYGRLSGRTQ